MAPLTRPSADSEGLYSPASLGAPSLATAVTVRVLASVALAIRNRTRYAARISNVDGVAALARPSMLFEIDAIVVRPRTSW